MTQTIAKTLYERDLNLWLENVIAQLKARDFGDVDLENLIEELEGLAGRDKRELKSRLRTLLEHLLKRLYVNMPDWFNGWENTIREQRSQIDDIIDQSPSLKAIFGQTFDIAWRSALKNVKQEYRTCNFPNTWQFSRDVETILSEEFWLG
jgi:hypothetical protein